MTTTLIVGFVIVFVVTAPFWFKHFKWSHKFYHNAFGWHDGDLTPHTFDGASNASRCSYCGKRVLQDSQGGWFLSTIQDGCKRCGDPLAYKGAVYCGAACTARWEAGDRTRS